MKMKKTFKEKWLKALRGGRYKQGTDTLHNITSKTSCCLGVLCRVAKVRDEIGGSGNLAMYDGSTVRLSNGLLKRFGLSFVAMNTLISLNDKKGQSFKQIADWIEKNL